MRKVLCLLFLALFSFIAVGATPSTAAQSDIVVHVNGGGTGLFVAPSVSPTDMGLTTNFAVGLTVHSDGSATGHFTCIVPGIVVVDGHYVSASYDETTGIVIASGVAVERFPGIGPLTASFTNTFVAGGPGEGIFTLTDDSGYFDGPPFVDTEVVIRGIIRIRS